MRRADLDRELLDKRHTTYGTAAMGRVDGARPRPLSREFLARLLTALEALPDDHTDEELSAVGERFGLTPYQFGQAYARIEYLVERGELD